MEQEESREQNRQLKKSGACGIPQAPFLKITLSPTAYNKADMLGKPGGESCGPYVCKRVSGDAPKGKWKEKAKAPQQVCVCV